MRFLLQATVNDIQQYGAMVVDIEVISRLIIRYKKFERLYLASNTVVPSHLDDALTSLYTEVLTYLARTIDVLSERTFGMFEAMLKLRCQADAQSANGESSFQARRRGADAAYFEAGRRSL